jgi:hypothetical protein
VKKKLGVGKTPKKAARRVRIAAGLIKGKSIGRIAKEVGVSRGYASREANSPAVALMIATLIDERSKVLGKLLDETIRVIADSYKAVRTVMDEHAKVNLGADHFARLAGVKAYMQLVRLGRANPKESEEREFQGATLQQMEAAVMAYEASNGE